VTLARPEDELHGEPDEPQPVDGCGSCDRLASTKIEARRGGDRSAVSDARVRLRQHLIDAHP
jgi:hypothetical protein